MAQVLCVLLLSQMAGQSEAGDVPGSLRPFFAPPAQYASDFGGYRSPLVFNDGTPVKTPVDWQKRRAEILATWRNLLGVWPPLIEKPKVEYLEQQHRDNFTQHKVLVESAPGGQTVAGYLLVPDDEGQGPANPIRNPQSEMPVSGGARGLLRSGDSHRPGKGNA